MDEHTAVKPCQKCGITKPLTDFPRHVGRADGYYSRCKRCKKADAQAYYEANRDKVLASNKARYQANREHYIKAAIAWKRANPDKAQRYRRTGYLRHKQEHRATMLKWRAANPDKLGTYWLRRRARVKNATIGTVDLVALWDIQGGLCALCGDPIDRSLQFPHPLSASVDHILPLAKGGAHEQSNLQWTHLVENQQKGASVPNQSLPL